jgi:hypothetical protein
VVEVLQRFDVQIHQLTPNVVVALAKYVWAVTLYGDQPSVEVFAKDTIAQFGSCTFTPRTGKTSAKVVELVPCARNKWGNWWDYWFYVSGGEVEDLLGLPAAVMCSHCYVAFPPFEVAEDDEDIRALRCTAHMSSERDLVEEFIGFGVWPLAHGWVLGEVCPRQMPTLGDQLVRSPTFALDLRGRNPAAFVREVEDGAMRIVGRYAPMTEALRSWDICGSNVRLNHVFELNHLPYGGYPGEDAAAAADRRGKKPAAAAEEGPSQEAVPASKKRKLGTATEGLGVSDRFVVELMKTYAAPGGRMSSPELRESSVRMLEVTGGRWPRNVPIPWAAGEDMFTSRLAREMKIFPYGRNVTAVVSAVMDKDRQDAGRKHRAFTRVRDPNREVKRVRGGAKSTAPGSSKPPPAAKAVVPRPSKSSSGARAAASGAGKSTSAEPTRERRPPSPVRTDEAAAGGADLDMDICVEDYCVGGVMMFDAHTSRGLVGEFFVCFLMEKRVEQDCGAGSNAGQLAIVPAPVAATPTALAAEAMCTPHDCASGKILSASAAKDMAGSVSEQLKHASQQLKHVSRIGLCQFVVFMLLRL